MDITPLASAAARVGSPTGVANWAAARAVARTVSGGTARATEAGQASAAKPSPRRARRRRSTSRARSSRPRSVPRASPNRAPASSSVSPSRWQRSTGARSGSGRRASSSWVRARASAQVRSSPGAGGGRGPGSCPARRGAGRQGPRGDAAGNPVQPAAEGVPLPDRLRLAGEDEEGGLEHVLGVLLVPEDGPGGVEYDGPVPLDQRGERGLVPVGGEPVEQEAVGR